MKKISNLILFSVLLIISSDLFASTDTISFNSEDGLLVVADTYIISLEPSTPIILLFHQAGWSRGEYIDIAPKLNELGFNCIAVDLRSGGKINSVQNLTAKRAKASNLPTRYVDSLPDIIAALHFIRSQLPKNKVLLWGSSYSASLVLHVAGKYPELVNGVLAFAPGEYFSKQGKPKTWIQDSATKINVPVFITSARNEKNNWIGIYGAIQSNKKSLFIPKTEGNHGSKALWEQFDDHNDYWDAVNLFLHNHFL